jgi:hypothetical protein
MAIAQSNVSGHRTAERLDYIRTQRYNGGVVIPDFDENNNLPPGIHDATVAEVRTRFANERRKQLFAAFEEVISILSECNCPEVYLDGSFITTKEEPNDYDLCYESKGIVRTLRLREFLTNSDTRKEKYLGDIFIHMPEPPYYVSHVEHWQKDGRKDGMRKGIVRIKLRQ